MTNEQTRALGRIVPIEQWDAVPELQYWLEEFRALYAKHTSVWARDTQSNEMPFAHLAMAAVIDDVEIQRHGLQYAESVATAYYLPNAVSAEWHAMPDSMAAAYLLTGETVYRQAVEVLASDAAFRNRNGAHKLPNWDLRQRNRFFRALLAAQRCGLELVLFEPNKAKIRYAVAPELAKYAESALAIQYDNGLFAFAPGEIKWFMSGEYCSTLAWWADMHEDAPRAAIAASVGRCLETMWSYYDTAKGGLPYTTPGTATKAMGDASSTIQPGLNAYWFYPAAWLARETDSPLWRERALTLLRDMQRDTYYRQSAKQFDQKFQFFAQGASLLVRSQAAVVPPPVYIMDEERMRQIAREEIARVRVSLSVEA